MGCVESQLLDMSHRCGQVRGTLGCLAYTAPYPCDNPCGECLWWDATYGDLPEFLEDTGSEVCVCDCDRCDNATALNCSARWTHGVALAANFTFTE